MNYAQLQQPVSLGQLSLKNRFVMAPMTRSRASFEGVPRPTTADYYAQRSGAGLLISEAINISQDAVGSPLTPGLYSDEQISAWKKVTDAVHAKGSKIVAQLWHTGRVGHSVVRGGKTPVAPSAIAIEGQQHFTQHGMKDYEVPRELTLDEIVQIISDYRRAAQNAKIAGFDGVELHAAFGYLPNQFLVDGANKRTDIYGGSIENRSRFVLDVMAELVDVWGSGKVGIKVSPTIPFNSTVDSDPVSLYSYLFGQMNEMHLAYVHLMEGLFPTDAFPHWPTDVLGAFGEMIDAPLLTNGGYTADSAEAVLSSQRANAVSFGTPFIANPDFPQRVIQGVALAEPDRNTMYGGDDEGYVDYPRATKEA